MPSPLLHFTITPTADGFELRMENEDGEVVDAFATTEQMDVIVEEIDRQLDVTAIDEEDLDEEEPGETEQ